MFYIKDQVIGLNDDFKRRCSLLVGEGDIVVMRDLQGTVFVTRREFFDGIFQLQGDDLKLAFQKLMIAHVVSNSFYVKVTVTTKFDLTTGYILARAEHGSAGVHTDMQYNLKKTPLLNHTAAAIEAMGNNYQGTLYYKQIDESTYEFVNV